MKDAPARVGLWTRIKAFLIWLTARLLMATVRVRVLHPERLDLARAGGKPLIYAFWHGRQLALFKINPEPRLAVMTSLSRDGAMQERICRRFGLRVVRGSSSRGGLGGLLALGRQLREGVAVAVAVDGPKGPAFEAKPGVAALGRATGSLIMPVTAGYRRAHLFSRAWDRFLLPAPFTVATVAFGEPLLVPDHGTAEVLERAVFSLTENLRALTAEVDGPGPARVG